MTSEGGYRSVGSDVRPACSLVGGSSGCGPELGIQTACGWCKSDSILINPRDESALIASCNQSGAVLCGTSSRHLGGVGVGTLQLVDVGAIADTTQYAKNDDDNQELDEGEALSSG